MEINPVEYPLYPYQKRRQYEIRLKETLPVSEMLKTIEKEIEPQKLENFRELQILVRVHKLEKVKMEAKKYISLYEDYIEAAFPEIFEEEEVEPSYYGFELKTIKPKELYLPCWYHFSISPKARTVKKEERRMVDYSRSYQLKLRISRDHKKWFFNFLSTFFYCQPIHRLDLVKLEIRSETFDGKIKILSRHVLKKTTFRMPIWGRAGFEEVTRKKLKEIFSNQFVLELLEDQLRQRYPFVLCLTLNGEPIPRRYRYIETPNGKRVREELTFDSAEEIKNFFEKEEGVEYYRSVDKRRIDKVDTLILEYDPPLRAEDEAKIWRQTVEDEERSLQLLIDRGLNLKSVEENFSGNKSLQRLIHIHPPISYIETRDFQYFLANLHKFEAARDSYFYTIDKESGLARVSKELVDWTYGRKKEIKCIPVPNTKREPIHCSISLEFSIKDGKIKFADWVFDLNEVREKSKWENVRERLLIEEGLPMEEKLYKKQAFYEKNATNPGVFQKLMEEFHWYKKAMEEIPPYELDLWRKEWIKEKFA